MAKVVLDLTLTYPDGKTELFSNLEQHNVNYNVSVAELQNVYVDELKEVIKTAAKEGVAIWMLDNQALPITLKTVPRLGLEIRALMEENG